MGRTLTRQEKTKLDEFAESFLLLLDDKPDLWSKSRTHGPRVYTVRPAEGSATADCQVFMKYGVWN